MLETDFRFPLKENCDLNKPEEFALWALVALPGQNGAPLIMPIEYLRMVSKRLWDCGFRHVEAPIIKYKPPTGSEPHWASAPGTWVDAGEPDPEPHPMRRAMSLLTAQQKAELLELLREEQNGD